MVGEKITLFSMIDSFPFPIDEASRVSAEEVSQGLVRVLVSGA